MGRSPHVAVAHYPEGAGHATRMLAVADGLTAGGARVSLAGGGAGSRFAELNGYDPFEPTVVDYIDTYQLGHRHEVLTRSLPATVGRLSDYVRWLRELSPDALVTDDMFAAMAARRVGVPQYVLKHDLPELYADPVERAGARFHTRFQLAAARAFFQPAVWPRTGTEPDGVTRVPPVALDGSAREYARAEARAPDVVVVPSAFSDLSSVTSHLEGRGFDVLDVGSEAWEPVPSLLPYLSTADLVVCSGYSTVMDAAVAGTPCVVSPVTSEQRAVAERLADPAVTGFAVADGPLDVVAAATDPPAPPAYENGASVVADRVLADLNRELEDGESPSCRGDAAVAGDRGTLSRWRRATTTTVASSSLGPLLSSGRVASRGVRSGARRLEWRPRSVGKADRVGTERAPEPDG